MKIAYFVNQYPKVSHTFIRREILALERLGFTVERFALRGWDAALVDEEDHAERQRTSFVLRRGVLPLLIALARRFVAAPGATWHAIRLAAQVALGGDRSWVHHAITLAEAALVCRWAQERGVRHLHAHFGTNSTEVAMLAHALGGPRYSFTVHGPEEWDAPRQLKLREKVRHAAFVVTISGFARSQLMRWADVADREKIHVVHCGLDDAYRSIPNMPAPDNHRLVCVGRLCTDKAQNLLIDALALLRDRGIVVELVLAGGGDDQQALEERIAAHALQAQVRLTGWVNGDQVREEFIAARAMVLPSFAEGLPVVVMEALALRRPVLTTFIAGIPELVRDGSEGWLFPAGSAQACADAVAACIAAPIEAVRAMGERGRARVLERHSVDVEAAKLAQLIHAASRVTAAS